MCNFIGIYLFSIAYIHLFLWHVYLNNFESVPYLISYFI